MPERMKPYFPSAILLLLVVYLGVQALTGQRGLLSGHERDALMVKREAQLAGIMDQRRDLEVRVRYLGRAPRNGGGTTLQHATATERDPPADARTSARGDYWIQAGAFSDRRAARRVADQLGDRATVDAGRNDGLFRVLVGPWPDPNAAERSRQAVIARGYADALLISAR